MGWAAVLVLVRTRCLGAFWVRLLMGSGGGIYVDGDKIMARCADRVRRVTKGTNAPRPVSITRPGKVTWRAWPATTLRSQWSSQAIAILHLVLVAAVLCRILGSVGVGGRGWSFPPPGLPLLIDGPVDPGSVPVAAKNSRAVFWGAVRAPGVRGCWGAVPCGASSPPPLAVALPGPCVFLLWGDLPNLSYLNSAHGCDGTVRRL